jgi:hypothetical protein
LAGLGRESWNYLNAREGDGECGCKQLINKIERIPRSLIKSDARNRDAAYGRPDLSDGGIRRADDSGFCQEQQMPPCNGRRRGEREIEREREEKLAEKVGRETQSFCL